MENQWKVIPLTGGKYEASSDGRIRRVNGNELKQSPDGNGYPQICIKYNGLVQTIAVHRLIARTFLTPKPGYQINHIDGVKTNNSISNLEYVTCRDNINHAFEIGLTRTRRKVIQFDRNMNFIREWPSIHSVRHEFNVAHVSSVCNGNRISHGNFIWKFKSDCHV